MRAVVRGDSRVSIIEEDTLREITPNVILGGAGRRKQGRHHGLAFNDPNCYGQTHLGERGAPRTDDHLDRHTRFEVSVMGITRAVLHTCAPLASTEPLHLCRGVVRIALVSAWRVCLNAF